MANKFEETFTNIADAIREKTGTTNKMKPEDMPSKISAISSGGMKIYFDAMSSIGCFFWGNAGITYDILNKVLNYNDTENVTSMYYAFFNCNNITTIPLINTKNVTTMYYMFSGCKNLEEIPKLDYSNATDLSHMLSFCYALKKSDNIDLSNVNSIRYMFYQDSKLESVNFLGNSNKLTQMNQVFSGCTKLNSIGLFDTSNVTDMQFAFSGCSSLKVIPEFQISKNMESYGFYDIFNGCSSLEEIHMKGMNLSFDISDSTKFTKEALVEILNNLATVTSTQTLEMGSTNLAKLTDEEKAIATNKGWVLS